MPDGLVRQLDAAVETHIEAELGFLRALVSEPSTVGNEAGAIEVLGDRLSRLGLDPTLVSIDDRIAADPLAGVPSQGYRDRHNLLATTNGTSDSLSLLINGHIDVVPAEGPGWSSPPFVPVLAGDRMYGRGAGDMKGGLVAATLALQAISVVAGDFLDHPMALLAVIEEECTGNGTLSALRSGIDAEVVLLPEPTNQSILLGGIGIVWLQLTINTRGGHAEAADRLRSPSQLLSGLIAELGNLERELNESIEEPFTDLSQPYNVNIGKIQAGDWASSVPAWVTLEVRIGFPNGYSHDEIAQLVEKRLGVVIAGPEDFSLTVTATGFRAEGYYLDPASSLVSTFSDVLVRHYGQRPAREVMGSTTDARYYVNHGRGEALCYGPIVGNMHGTDEYVVISSIVETAKHYASFIVSYLSGELDILNPSRMKHG
ncbi:M20/M25/M40 family metallo-hydrolase [Ferrimicrobium sp.]|uniref:M20/M25/M40 family metallo-hydrolase n=1 Tax=Ferrimicrobium sp. TaxID=2926050 RepID=UPI0026141338|nr:M20/M25/M40 family metallo-hydrolase [Ferrimicrobium sp.]